MVKVNDHPLIQLQMNRVQAHLLKYGANWPLRFERARFDKHYFDKHYYFITSDNVIRNESLCIKLGKNTKGF